MIRNGVMHVHSDYSYDAKLSLDELRSFFKEQGMAFVCLTEHAEHFAQDNVKKFITSCRQSSDQDFVFIPGFEIPCDGQHVMLLGVDEIDLSLPPIEILKAAKKGGSLVVLAHPHRGKFSTGHFGSLLDGAEVWNSQYDGKMAPRSKSLEFIKNLNLRAFAGLDFHRKEHFGDPIISIETDALSEVNILTALKQGNYALGQGKYIVDSRGQVSGNRIMRDFLSFASIYFIFIAKKIVKILKSLGLNIPGKLKESVRRKI